MRNFRSDRFSFAQLLDVVGDHQRPAVKTALDNPVVAVLSTKSHVVHVNRVIRGYGINLLLPLEFVYC